MNSSDTQKPEANSPDGSMEYWEKAYKYDPVHNVDVPVKPEADSIEQPDSSDIEKILRKYGSDLAFFIAKNPKLDDFGLQCETDVLIEEAVSQLEAMMVKEVELARLKDRIKYLTLKARYQRVFLGGDEEGLKTKQQVKRLKSSLKSKLEEQDRD